jgi:hypothetical protein
VALVRSDVSEELSASIITVTRIGELGTTLVFLRSVHRLKSDGVTGGWRKLHIEELHNSYSSPSIIRIIKSRRMRMGGTCGTNGREGGCV